MGEISTSKKLPFGIKMTLICLPFFALAVLLAWISIIVNFDGVLRLNTFLISSLDLLVSVSEIGVYASSFAFIVSAVENKKNPWGCFAIFIALSAARYSVSAIINGVAQGGVSLFGFAYAATVLIIDSVILAALTLVAFLMRRHRDKLPHNIGEAKPRRAISAFSFSETSEKSLLIAGAVWASIQLISQMIYDISYISVLGALSASNIIWMIVYYLFAILICPVFYIISSLLLRYIRKNQDKSF